MYLLVYGLSLPPSPSSTPPIPHYSIVCLLHTPEQPVFEMYAFLNGYPVLVSIYLYIYIIHPTTGQHAPYYRFKYDKTGVETALYWQDEALKKRQA